MQIPDEFTFFLVQLSETTYCSVAAESSESNMDKDQRNETSNHRDLPYEQPCLQIGTYGIKFPYNRILRCSIEGEDWDNYSDGGESFDGVDTGMHEMSF